MSVTPSIIMVGADKGGVGKTTVARALIDYYTMRGQPCRVFDTQYPEGDLKNFCASAEVINLEETTDQMKVFDQLDATTVIDIRGGLLASTISVLDHVGLLEDVRSGAVNLIMLHVLGPSVASLQEVVATAKRLGATAKVHFVKNHVSPTEYYGWEHGPRFAEALKLIGEAAINVPYLDHAACEKAQQLGVGFNQFSNDASQSRILRGYMRAWLATVHGEFKRVGL